jgi:hypothetical protein
MSYIYIIKEREFIRLNEDVYKVGITKEPNFTNYPKGSEISFYSIIDEGKMPEIITTFKTLFEHTEEYGEEYFKGDVNVMIKTVISMIYNIKEGMEDQIKSLETQLNSTITSRDNFFSISEKQNIILQQQKVVLEKALKENEELKAKVEEKNTDYKLEYDNFFKILLKRADNSKYEKVYLTELHVVFCAWCKAKGITKLPEFDEFGDKVEEKYKIKVTDNEPNEYLEMTEYKV